MKRSAKSLIGFTIGATDGEIGKVKEFYFDDETWTIRYLIVETGSWLIGRKVLIAPEALLAPDWEKKIFPVNLTKEQIKNSPPIDTDKPVSRQEEDKLYKYYSWKNYWGGSFTVDTALPIGEAELNDEKKISEIVTTGDRHLRSTNEVTGYNLKATYGEIGDVEDFLIDETTWKLDFLVVDIGHWLPGKKVLISPKWITAIDWATKNVTVNATIDSVRNSPEYDENRPMTVEYETELFSHYNGLVSHTQ